MKRNYCKTKISTIALILLLTISATSLLLPVANAHTPPLEIRTYAYITVAPNPIGVNQPVRILMWLDQTFKDANARTNDYRFHNYKLTITKPDDTTETKTWDVCEDTTSSQGYSYTPNQVGTYTLKFEFPGQDYDEYSHNPDSDYVNDTYTASSASTKLIVQENPIEYYPSVPFPVEYWTRPIYGENTNWWSISSDYFGEGSPQQARKYIPDAVGPLTSHVMWTKALQSGGVVGGDNLEIQGDTYFEGTSRLTRFRNPIILCGKLYFTEQCHIYRPVDQPSVLISVQGNSFGLDLTYLRYHSGIYSRFGQSTTSELFSRFYSRETLASLLMQTQETGCSM